MLFLVKNLKITSFKICIIETQQKNSRLLNSKENYSEGKLTHSKRLTSGWCCFKVTKGVSKAHMLAIEE